MALDIGQAWSVGPGFLRGLRRSSRRGRAICIMYGFIFMHFSGLQGGYNQLEASGGGWHSGAMHQWIPEKGSPPSPGHLPDQEVAQGSNMAKGEK